MKHELNQHYKNDKIKTDVITFTQEHNLDFIQGNVMKYIYRYKLKGTPVEDLIKVIDYTTRALSKQEYTTIDIAKIVEIIQHNLSKQDAG
jgi:GTP cyclohydrolase I